MKWRRIAYLLYPILVGFLLPVLFYMAGMHVQEAKAGSIRRAELSTERPLTVRLAIGRSTALSFPVRPEKVVAGNPQALEVNFLGRDLTLRPLGQKPGNLIVYTKGNRYVILLQLTSEGAYDDAVLVNSFASYSRPLRLSEDTFLVEEVKLKETQTKKVSKIPVIVRRQGQILESEAFPDGLKCAGCVSRKHSGAAQLLCANSKRVHECRVGRASFILERQESED